MWTEQETKILRDLWKKGLTASQIASHIPGKTRNACIGRAHRLNLEARAVSRKTTSKVKTENIVPDSNRGKKLGRKVKFSSLSRFRSLLLDKNFESENPKTLEELTDKNCKWPIGHPNEKDFYFCGRKPMEKFPYCKLHLLYAYQPKNAKEEDTISEEDIPQFIEKKIKSA